MTSAEMLAHVRMKLDEDSAGFWSDAQIYESLTHGQVRLGSFLASKKHRLADDLITYNSYSYSTTTEPTDMMFPITVKAGSYSYKIRTGDRYRKELNTYLAGTSTDPYVYFYGGSVDFDPTLSSGTWEIGYYKIPTDIDGSTQPILKDSVHPIIVQSAYAELLLRDEKFQEASLEFQKYDKMVSEL